MVSKTQTLLRLLKLVVLGKPLRIRQINIVLVLGIFRGQLECLQPHNPTYFNAVRPMSHLQHSCVTKLPGVTLV